jgi:putative membrane protein
MDEYLLFTLDKLAMAGFLDTRAPLYMDIIISFLALLPILSGISIFFAIRKQIKLHKFFQFLLFFLSIIALVLFAYTVHYAKGFEGLLEKSSIDSIIALIVLIVHIIISIVTLTLWMFALMYALSDTRRRGLPGVYSESHAQAGKRVFKGIILTALSSVGIYWVLFMA